MKTNDLDRRAALGAASAKLRRSLLLTGTILSKYRRAQLEQRRRSEYVADDLL